MNNTPALDFRIIDLKNLVVPPLQKKDHGGLSTTPLYKVNGEGTPQMLTLQTPIVGLPFGLSDNTQQKTYQAGQPVRYSVNGGFNGYQSDPLMKQFFGLFSQFEEYAIHLAAHNSEEWFGEECDAKGCRMLFNKLLKMPKKEDLDKYAPTFKANVRAKKDTDGNQKEGEFWTTLYDIDGTELDLRTLQKGCRGSMKIKLSSFYIINGKFGWTWDVEWIRLTEHASSRTLDWNPSLYGEAVPAVPSMPSGNHQEPPSAYIPLNLDQPFAATATVSGASVQAVKRERAAGNEGNNVDDETAAVETVDDGAANNNASSTSSTTKRIKRST